MDNKDKLHDFLNIKENFKQYFVYCVFSHVWFKTALCKKVHLETQEPSSQSTDQDKNYKWVNKYNFLHQLQLQYTK